MRRLIGIVAAFELFCMTALAQFQAPQLYAVGANPNAVAVADVNGDGKLDLVTVNATLAHPNIFDLSVLLGNGDGTFQPAVTMNLPFAGANLVVADMNGDHIPDLVITAESDTAANGTVIVMLGKGNGRFSNPVSYYAGGYAYYLAVGDVNGDGKLDVVCTNVTNEGQPSLAVLMGNGDGSLQAPTFYFPPAANQVILADFNKDGHLDIATSDSLAVNGFLQVDVLLNNGDGTFGPYVQYNSDAPGPLAAGDVNNDGNIDLVTAGLDGGEISTDLGNGNGTFQAPIFSHAQSLGVYGMVLQDFNDDGFLDLIVADGPEGKFGYVNVMRGTGTGSFEKSEKVGTGGRLPSSIAAADFNRDGKLDFVVANSLSSNVAVFLHK
jgi:hypothetical protein